MRKLIIPTLFIFLAFFIEIAWGGTPYRLLLKSYTTSALSQGSKDTIFVSDLPLTGDSVGVQADFNRDSVSGYFVYQMVTPAGYSDVAFSNANTFSAFDCNDGEQAVFSEAIPLVAGNYSAYLYLIITNDDSESQTITINFYSVTWR